IKDFSNSIVRPSLVDCHTHLLEFAPASLYPITQNTHFIAEKSVLVGPLTSGITAVGQQKCGHQASDSSIAHYRAECYDLPMDVLIAAASVFICFEELAHVTSVTRSEKVHLSDLSDPFLVKNISWQNEYPGENIFINATAANFTKDEVPRAGEILFTPEELKRIVSIYHESGKRIGVHVAGEEGIQITLDAGVDVRNHVHSIKKEQIKHAK